jgi:hypothetical protein
LRSIVDLSLSLSLRFFRLLFCRASWLRVERETSGSSSKDAAVSSSSWKSNDWTHQLRGEELREVESKKGEERKKRKRKWRGGGAHFFLGKEKEAFFLLLRFPAPPSPNRASLRLFRARLEARHSLTSRGRGIRKQASPHCREEGGNRLLLFISRERDSHERKKKKKVKHRCSSPPPPTTSPCPRWAAPAEAAEAWTSPCALSPQSTRTSASP